MAYREPLIPAANWMCSFHHPSPADLIVMVGLAATEVRSFGIEPKAALLSQSNFGSSGLDSAVRMRESVAALKKAYPDMEIEAWEAELYEDIESRGWHEAQYNKEALSVLKTKLGNQYDSMIHLWGPFLWGSRVTSWKSFCLVPCT